MLANYKEEQEILFFDIAYSFDLYKKIFMCLKSQYGLSVRLLSLNKRKVSYFREHGLIAEYINITNPLDEQLDVGKQLVKALENYSPNYRLDLSIRRDRFLRWRSRNYGRRLLYAAASLFDAHLQRGNVKLVVGEISTAIEYLFYFLSEYRGIPYRHLLNLPSRNPLITLFDFEHSTKGTFFVGQGKTEHQDSKINYDEICRRLRYGKKDFNYFLHRVSLVYSTSDYRTHFKYKLRYLLKPFYKVYYLVLEKLFAEKPKDDQRNVFVPLHVQPESTPDFVSLFYCDQFELIKKLSDAAPIGTFIYVKEHPNVLSLRNPFRFFSLLLRKNVKLLRRNDNAITIMKKMQCVITIAGTTAMQAAAIGIPAITYSGIFLNELPNVIDGRSFNSLAEVLNYAFNLKPEPIPQPFIESFLKRIGLPGYIHDPRILPEVLSDRNIKNICHLIVSFIKKRELSA